MPSTKLLVVIIIYILTSIYDMNTRFKTCLKGNIKILPVLLFHRLLWVFLFFGWIFDSKFILIIYLLFNIGLQIHWLFNNNECVITQIERKMCKLPADSYSDYFYNLFGKNISLYYGVVQLIFCTIVVWKLTKNK